VRSGGGDRSEQVRRVIGTVSQQQHALTQQGDQLAGGRHIGTFALAADHQRLAARARERWPQLSGITVRYHGEFAYVTGQLPDGTTVPLCRLRYAESATS
jgi:hypothetical protein